MWWRVVGSMSVVASLWLAMPAALRAERDNHRELHRAADQLRDSMNRFADIAASRPLSSSDRNAIRGAKRSVRELTNAVRRDSWHDVREAFYDLRPNMSSLDRQLHWNRNLRGDHRLWNSWADVTEHFETVSWYLGRGRSRDDYDHRHRHGDRDWDGDHGHGHGDHGGHHSGHGSDVHGYNNGRSNFGLQIQVGPRGAVEVSRGSVSTHFGGFDPRRVP